MKRILSKFNLALVIFTLSLLACGKETEAVFSFESFPWDSHIQDALLCYEAPLAPTDTQGLIFLNCNIEGGNFSESLAAPKDELLVFAYNIERGHSGDAIIDLLMSEVALAQPDIILLSEVDRFCSSSMGGQNFAKVLADSLNMYYVYGTEFYDVDEHCEMGNAILSKYPIGNVQFNRFEAAETYYLYTDSGYNYRQGGRSYISGHIQVGDKYVRVYSTHLAASFFDNALRIEQAAELVAHAETNAQGKPIIIGGDFNSYIYSFYLNGSSESRGLAEAFFSEGYTDTHTSLPFQERVTNFSYTDFVIDLIFVKGLSASEPSVGNEAVWDNLSDHKPVWVKISL